MQNNISRMVIMFGNIFLEIKLAELLSLKGGRVSRKNYLDGPILVELPIYK